MNAMHDAVDEMHEYQAHTLNSHCMVRQKGDWQPFKRDHPCGHKANITHIIRDTQNNTQTNA